MPTMSIRTFEEIASLVARHAKDEGANSTAIGSLLLTRHTSLSPSVHCAQSPMFGMVVQGRRSIELGGKIEQFGIGDYLFVSLDVPVASRCVFHANRAAVPRESERAIHVKASA
jgi:AraC-type transcriptional regulator N-terminus